jgi:hypothetical protein
VHNFTVALRIYGKSLDVGKISQDLKTTPTQTRLTGEHRGENSKWNESMWEWEARPRDGGHWPSLETGLAALMEAFGSQQEKLRQYQNEHSVVIWCGHFSSSFDGGPRFSAGLLKALADFGVELFIDTYVHGETAEQEPKLG